MHYHTISSMLFDLSSDSVQACLLSCLIGSLGDWVLVGSVLVLYGPCFVRVLSDWSHLCIVDFVYLTLASWANPLVSFVVFGREGSPHPQMASWERGQQHMMTFEMWWLSLPRLKLPWQFGAVTIMCSLPKMVIGEVLIWFSLGLGSCPRGCGHCWSY